jgi:exodeoxyribonuclease-3
LRIATWNVNSLRQRLDHLARFVAARQPDLLCLQETKVEDSLFPAHELAALGYPHQQRRGQKSYNGVAILSKRPFRAVDHRIWCERDDKRHVSVVVEGDLELHCFYVPSGGPIPDPEQNPRFAHKLRFLEEMARWSSVEAKGRKALILGDLNVAPLDNDVWNHRKQLRSVGHTPVESEKIAQLLAAGHLTDLGRHFVPPSQPLYTWWGYRFPQAFERNYGWRLDHALASESALSAVKSLEVFKESRSWDRPSDHVPVILELG